MSNKMLQQSALSGLMFFAMSLPDLYIRSNKFLETEGSCPNWKSRLLHTIAFFVLNYLVIMYVEKPANMDGAIKRCTYSALLFFLLSSPEVYRLTDALKVLDTADDNACPTITGVLVHSGLYVVADLLIQHMA
jgi:hypothetical protein